MRLATSVATLLLGVCVAAPATAQSDAPGKGFLRLGVTRVRLADKGKIFINNSLVPGGGYRTPEKWVPSAEAGYFLLPNLALQLGATGPASTSNTPAGSLAGTPNLGSDRFSIFTATGAFHPFRLGPVSPYLGGGIAWQHTWSTHDGLATNLRVHDTSGPVIQGGAELRLAHGFGLFVDAKKAFYTADASGDLGPSHVTARAKLDPLLLQAGASIHF